MNGIVLVDAYSQIYRCFYAIKGLTNPKNEPVNALYGLVRLLLLLDKTQPCTYGAIAFDKGKACKRTAICPEYKAQRPPMPDNLRAQIQPIRDWMTAFGWTILEQEGLEADDIIGAIARRRQDQSVFIVTHDKDISQLTADPGVILAMPVKNENWEINNAATVQAKFGVSPQQLGDYLALVGDTADNIIGLPGIGPKTAAKILNENGTLAHILENPQCLNNPKLIQTFTAHEELIRRNIQLVALDDELPAGFSSLDSIKKQSPDWELLIAKAQEQGFKSILPVLQKRRDEAKQPTLFNF